MEEKERERVGPASRLLHMGIRHRAARATPTATPLGDSSGGLNLSLSVCLSRVLGWSLVAGRRWCCSSAALLLALAGQAAGGGLLRAGLLSQRGRGSRACSLSLSLSAWLP